MILNNRHNVKNLQLIFFASMIILFCVFVLAVPRISLPISLAYILSLALNPFISALINLGLNRTRAIILVFMILMVSIGFPLFKVIPLISMEAENIHYNIPKIEQSIISTVDQLRMLIKAKTGYEIQEKLIFDTLEEFKNNTAIFMMKLPNFLAILMEWIFLIPLFTFFILKDSYQFKKIVLDMTPNQIFERFYHVSHTFNRQLGNYFFAKFVEAFIVGFIITTGLVLLNVDYAILLGIIAGATNIVPYLGPFLGAIPAIIFAFAEYGVQSPTFGAIMLLYVLANVIDIFFVFPFLVSKIVNLHPMIVAVSVIIGSHYLGITGMVISIPVVAALKLIVIEIYNEIYTERSR